MKRRVLLAIESLPSSYLGQHIVHLHFVTKFKSWTLGFSLRVPNRPSSFCRGAARMVNDADGGDQGSQLLAGVKQLLENAVGPSNARLDALEAGVQHREASTPSMLQRVVAGARNQQSRSVCSE